MTRSSPVAYYVQFTAGTADLLRDALPARCRDTQVRYADDSALIFTSSSPPAEVAQVPFFKNAFVVLGRTGRGQLDRGIPALAKALRAEHVPDLPDAPSRFRIMVHVDGALAPVAARSRSDLERALARATGGRVEPRGRCREYWVVGRQDLDELLLCARLPRPPTLPRARGALAPELSAMLAAASGPDRRDRVLDPFAGSGALLAARSHEPFRQLLYSDLDLAGHRASLPPELADRRVSLLAEDGRNLPSVADGSVDVVVTDPPWGEHEELDDYGAFSDALAASLARVLHPAHGRYVVLVNRRNADLVSGRLDAVALAPQAEHPVLVNGHPATVLVGARTRPGRTGSGRHGGNASSTSARTAR